MNTRINTIAQEMCKIKDSFERIYDLVDDEENALEAFGYYDSLMKKLGEGFAFAIVSNLK